MNQNINTSKHTENYLFKGSSMEPVFKEGDVLYSKKISLKKIKKDDFLIFLKNKQLLCHRVIYLGHTHVVTKGDNCLRSDGKVYANMIVGKVVEMKRHNTRMNPSQLFLIQSTLYFEEIVKIVRALEKDGVRYVILKGLPLHLYYEKTYPKRFYADCDLLIDKYYIQRVTRIMKKYGYSIYDQSLSQIHSSLRTKQTEIVFKKNISSLDIYFDIHLEVDWMSQQIGRLDVFYPQNQIEKLTEEFLESRRQIVVNRESFYMLPPPYLFTYLALHLFHHNVRGVFRYDIMDRVVRMEMRKSHKSICTSDVIINQYKLNALVFPVFQILKHRFNTPIPAAFLRSVMPRSDIQRRHIQTLTQTDIFDNESRLRAGVNRLFHLFILSPNPWWKKILIVLYPQILFSILWFTYYQFKRRIMFQSVR